MEGVRGGALQQEGLTGVLKVGSGPARGSCRQLSRGWGKGFWAGAAGAQCPSERRVLRALAADGPLHGLRRGPEESTLNSACYSYIPQGATLKITSSGVPTKLGLGLGQGRWQGGMWVPCRPRTV